MTKPSRPQPRRLLTPTPNAPLPGGVLERLFQCRALGSTPGTEMMAGVTTFLTMSYIIFVNPQVLAQSGMDQGAVFTATCLASAFACLIMGLVANYPIALAPGMGLNAYFSYSVVLGMGYPWPTALGAVFISAGLSLILTVLPVRAAIIRAVPRSLKLGIAAGIGLFLGLIALKNAGIVVPSTATLVTLGNLTQPRAVLAALGFAAAAALTARKVPGALLIAVLGVTLAGIVLGLTPFHGLVSAPPGLAKTFMQLDLRGAFNTGLLTIIFAFLFVDIFDNAGTLIGVSHRAGLLDKDGQLPRLHQALLADAGGSVIGSALGTSTITSYIESVAGIEAGGRTGLVAVTVAVLFLASLVLAPLAISVPDFATAPALLFVACLMARSLSEIDWEDATEYVPGVVTALAMPFSFSIANGIALGFITYGAIKLAAGRWRDVHWIVGILSVLFVAKFIWLGSD